MPDADPRSGQASLLDYLRLFRIPNVFTALADVAMGFLFVHGGPFPVFTFLCLLISSGLLYTAGMVLNDVYDVDIDSQERPDRPIPSGRIALAKARSIGFGMLISGVGFAWLAGFVQPVEKALVWRGGAVALALAVCVVLYDGVLKRTAAAPMVMGLCRLFNVLLGMSIAAPYVDGWNLAGFGQHHLFAAAGIGVYIAGVTLFARTEARQSARWMLIAGLIVQIAGFGLLGMIYRSMPAGVVVSMRETTWYLLLGMLAFTIMRRATMAISDPSPSQVQMAVKHSILSLIVLDAAVVLVVNPPQHWYYAVAVLALLVPTIVLGKWVYST